MRDGIVTRGVLLDVAAAAGRPWLETQDVVTPELLDAAEAASGVAVSSGDAVFVHTGLERRQAGANGPEDVNVRCGLDHASVVWLHQHEVSVFAGDCTEQLPGPGGAVPFPLHQIGISAMGLAMLDNPTLTPLLHATTTHGSNKFMLVIAPLRIPGATGSPVNPIAIF
jgi:kynurenine formamidase